MATCLDCEREDDRPSRRTNTPLKRDERQAEDDHPGESEDRDNVGCPETLEYCWDFLEEVGKLDLLLSRTPCDVVGEQVRKNGTRKVQTQAAEEEETAQEYETIEARARRRSQERYPLNIGPEGLQ